jgi:hypothetical protein
MTTPGLALFMMMFLQPVARALYSTRYTSSTVGNFVPVNAPGALSLIGKNDGPAIYQEKKKNSHEGREAPLPPLPSRRWGLPAEYNVHGRSSVALEPRVTRRRYAYIS